MNNLIYSYVWSVIVSMLTQLWHFETAVILHCSTTEIRKKKLYTIIENTLIVVVIILTFTLV